MCRGFRVQPEVHARGGDSTSQALRPSSEGLTRVRARVNRCGSGHQGRMADDRPHVRKIGEHLSPREKRSKRRPISWPARYEVDPTRNAQAVAAAGRRAAALRSSGHEDFRIRIQV
jgi:hypothetical protein